MTPVFFIPQLVSFLFTHLFLCRPYKYDRYAEKNEKKYFENNVRLSTDALNKLKAFCKMKYVFG